MYAHPPPDLKTNPIRVNPHTAIENVRHSFSWRNAPQRNLSFHALFKTVRTPRWCHVQVGGTFNPPQGGSGCCWGVSKTHPQGVCLVNHKAPPGIDKKKPVRSPLGPHLKMDMRGMPLLLPNEE